MQVGWSGLALQLYVYVAIAFQLYLTVVYVALVSFLSHFAFGRFSVVRLCRFSSFTTSLSVPRKEPIEKVCRLVNEIN